jgi:hypothetical protein
MCFCTQVGVSIFKGGASTFLGICLLSGSASYVFRLFFKMLMGVVALGLLVGYFLYPSLLTLGAALAETRAEAWPPKAQKTQRPPRPKEGSGDRR